MLKEIKSIPLADFLSQLGHKPTARKGTRLWYKSPLRQEQTPSFKVDTALNCWYDFGLGKGGNIIDLAAEIYRSTDLRNLMRCIADSCPVPSVQIVASTFAPRHSAPSMERFEVVPLEHRALVAYLQERGIPAHIATAHCKEAHYCVNGDFILPWHLRMSAVAGTAQPLFQRLPGTQGHLISAVGERWPVNRVCRVRGFH